MKKYLRLKFFLTISVMAGLLVPFLARAQGDSLNPAMWGAKLGASVAKSAGSLFSISGIATKVIGWLAYTISYLLSSLASVVIMLQTWITQIVLHMNGQVIQSAIVQNGFQVTLSIANLGFITALIIIALATILRRETYGIKQLLWKLIVAALLVNFSLVFAGVIINFSDQLTGYFLKAFPGQGGGSIIANNPYDAGASNFAERLVIAFQPQQYLSATGGVAGGNVDLAIQASAGWSSFASTGSSIGQMLAPIASVVMITLGLLMIVIILAVFNFMLIVRYLYLSVLLVLMPLAWVAWIFPSMHKHWGDWWSKFLKWAFFAPIVIFFMWLVITTGDVMGNSQNTGSPFYGVEANFSSTAGSPLERGISNFFGGAFTPIILTFLKGIVLVGLMAGGLIVAKSLSITGASAGIAAAQKIGKGVQGYAVRKGKQIGTAPLRTKPFQKLATGMQTTGAGGRGLLGKLKQFATIPVRYAGKGMEAAGGAQGEKMVTEATGRQKDLTTNQLIHSLPTMPAPDRIAALDRIHKEGRTSEINNLDSYIGGKKEDEFNRYNSGVLFKKLQGESGWKLNQLRKELETAEKGGDEEQVKITQDSIAKHFRAAPNPGLLGETFFQDIEKLKKTGFPMGMKEEEYSKMQQVVARGVATGFSPNNAAKFFDKLNRGDQLDAFTEASKKAEIKNEEISERLKDYLGGSGARNLGVSVRIFGEKAEVAEVIKEGEKGDRGNNKNAGREGNMHRAGME